MARWMFVVLAISGCGAHERPPGVNREELTGQLTVTVAEGGTPTSARVIASVRGDRDWAPTGVELRMTARGGRKYFYTTGVFTLSVPADRVVEFEITRGPEYDVARGQATVGAGHSASITLPLVRWTNKRTEGWYSGDMHIHMNYSSPRSYTMTPAASAEILKAEDLAVGNFLAGNGDGNGNFVFDEQYLNGQPMSVDPRTLYCVGEEFRPAGAFGHAIFLGIPSPVRPFFTNPSPSPTPTPAPYRSLADAAAEARRNGGLVSFAHPLWVWPSQGVTTSWELPVAAALGVVDSVDILHLSTNEDASSEIWYKLLNTGSKLAATAGTDTELSASDPRSPPLGCDRVYVKADAFDFRSWLDGIRRRRTFVTNGPMLSLTVEGAPIGESISIPSPGPVRVVAEARSSVDRPFTKLDILVNGEPVRRMTNPSPMPTLSFDQMITINESSWIAARIADAVPGAEVCEELVYAHTSPIWVLVDNAPVRSANDANYLVGWLDAAIGEITRTEFTVAGKQALIDQYQTARNHYDGLR